MQKLLMADPQMTYSTDLIILDRCSEHLLVHDVLNTVSASYQPVYMAFRCMIATSTWHSTWHAIAGPEATTVKFMRTFIHLWCLHIQSLPFVHPTGAHQHAAAQRHLLLQSAQSVAAAPAVRCHAPAHQLPQCLSPLNHRPTRKTTSGCPPPTLTITRQHEWPPQRRHL